jgi:hypothetical protein
MDCRKTILVIVEITLIVINTVSYFSDEPVYMDYLKDPSKEPRTCDDFKFGCCEIYPTCHFEEDDNSTLHVENIELNFKVGVKHDDYGLNCPRIKDIVYLYNSLNFETPYDFMEYNDGCLEKNSMYKCCSVDYMCDERYYTDFIIYPLLHEGDYRSIYDTVYNGTEVLVLNKATPTVHFECPSIDEIVNVYQREMMIRKEKSIIQPIIIVFQYVILSLTLLFAFGCISCDKCCKKETGHVVLRQGV